MISRLSSSSTSSRCHRLSTSLLHQRWNGYRLPATLSLTTATSFPTTSILTTSVRPFRQEQVQWYSSTTITLKSSVVKNDDEDIVLETPSIRNDGERSVEDTYSRKTPLEHVLLRPGMYVGAVERLPPNQCWVVDYTFPPPNTTTTTTTDKKSPMKMVRKDFGIVPALIKVFDEILVNASDNRLRHPDSCSALDVIIDAGSKDKDPFISVYNDGKGVPVEIHKKEQLYVPELLFGHLLTGSNFDDNEKRITGGRHGYGAKLTNIFSKSFTVETLDAKRKRRYQQTWNDNMTVMSEPEITKVPAKEKDYTRVSFVPDMPKLTGTSNQRTISDEDYAIMCRRVVDVAGCAAGALRVTLNGKDVSFSSFEEYSNMYRQPNAPPLKFAEINQRWKVGIGLSESGSFDSVSFVNGMATSRGGTHVNAIVQQVTKHVEAKVTKKHPDLSPAISQSLIRRNLFVVCDALIENPSFDSQMKESLTSSPDSFGSSCKLSTKFMNELVIPEEDGGPGIVEEIVRIAQRRFSDHLLKEVGGSNKTKRQLLSIPKLEDAHSAGSEKSMDCTLILTEGDSAKALAIAGLEVIGRERYGVFPLRGKFLNVRDATVLQLAKNAEVKALCAILGLDFDKEYDTVAERSELRYGHVMLMTDQDNDGSHIKGLVVNFFRHFWPKLLKPAVDQPLEQPFLSSFITPLLKATKKGKKETLSFYSMAEFIEWRSAMSNPDEIKTWNIKYYKGLGTSTPAEAKEYFKAFQKHHRPFHWNSEQDGELLDMVFDKNRASDRRKWILEEYDEEKTTTPDPDRNYSVTYEDFINNELIHFSNADNIRSLPNVVDGLKPSQRKVLYACFKRKLKAEVKVAQLSGYCAEHTAYHHGEASLQSTIIGMAQDFCGANNINLLVPQGQFGTRLAGGDDAASPRYIFTYLSPMARYLFPEADDALLNYLEDDGQVIEPEFFCPIIPLLLVNGSQGIGTGWSTYIPPHNPVDVLNYIRAKLDGTDQNVKKIRPWARGFTGSIEPKEDGSGYVSTGRAAMVNKNSVLIDELPVRQWTDDYKEHLIRMRDKGEITHFVENHTTTSVSFTVKLTAVALQKMSRSGLEKAFKLQANLATTNMHAFDANGVIVKFGSAESIADAFFPTRLALYRDRKSVLESEMTHDATVLRNKARFITSVTSGEIDLVSGRKTRGAIVEALHNLSFVSASALKVIKNNNTVAERRRQKLIDDDVTEADDMSPNAEFDYLLNMPLSSLTTERIAALQSEALQRDKELAQLVDTTPEDLWRNDLEKLAGKLEKHL